MEINAPSINERAALQAPAAKAGQEDAKLQEACRGFESFFLSIILKQGMQGGSFDEEAGGGQDMMRELALEQTARQLGEEGATGLGDTLYQQFRFQMGALRHD